MTIDINQLEVRVESMKINLKLINSAIKIQRHFRNYLSDKKNKLFKVYQN